VPTIEERLQKLEDKEEILHVLHRYAYAMDFGRDPDEWMDLYTEDGVWKGNAITSTAGAGSGDRIEGRKALAEWYMRSGRATDEYWGLGRRQTHHNIAVVDVKLDGNRATAVSYMTITQEDAKGPRLFGIGRYSDVLVKCDDGRWRFKVRHLERTCVTLERQTLPMQTPTPDELRAAHERFKGELEATRAGKR
jgi:hypothetical protein